ncbi:MAG: c-type cytochrome [Ramlibacter sp.]|nr:c-type cytochrome [Ramlibacter sp.]
MTRRMRVAMGTAAAAMLVALPVFGQTAAAPPVDLNARLKDVEASPARMEAMFRIGKKVAGFCENCHGEGGNSAKPDVPNLAGQNAYYLLAQLREFSTTQRKSNEFKKRLVNIMSPDEKVGMVVFYANQAVAVKPAANPALARSGGELYAKRCAECHERDGRGTREYSRIAGQQTVYLTQSLKGYRDGTGARLDREMVAQVKPLTDSDIAAVVAYVSSMK